MALAPGLRLGPYEIQSVLGAGGMGEVYRAIDTNLGRQVAIKVLPEAFAGDPDRLARFEREAKVLAALNHVTTVRSRAFGCVLYEMFTGRRAFAGADVTDTLARILLKEPEWEALPRSTPPAVARLLRRCLEKDPRQRLPHMAIARYEMQDTGGPAAPAVAVPSPGRRTWLAWAAGLGIIAAAGIGFTVAFVLDEPAASPVSRFAVEPPPDSALRVGVNTGSVLALSPDGRRLVFVVSSKGRTMLALRAFDALESRVLAGTEGTSGVPFWSPDGRYVAFFADAKLKRVDPDGGPPQVLADAPGGFSGTWSQAGVIVFSTGLGGLRQVAAAGGMPADLTTLDTAREETSHRYPRFLPDGNRFLYIAQPGRTVFLAGLDGREPKVVLSGVSAPFYLDPGFLVYTREGTLSAQRFDPDAERLSDEVVSLVERIWESASEDSATLSVSNTGVLAYATQEDALELIAVDRGSGREQSVGSIRAINIDLAPSGRPVAFQVRPGASQPGIWILDLERQVTSPLALSTSTEQFTEANWSPDGRKVAFRATRPSGVTIVAKPANGGPEETLYEGPGRLEDWSPDGQHLIVQPARQSLVVPLAGERKPVVFSTESIDEPHFSPDGRWIAYNTTGGAVPEVYVTRFPPTGERWRISLNGGAQPRWRGDGRELYFLAPDGKMMAASLQTQPEFKPGVPQALFDTRLNFVSTGIDQYGVTPDGQRFVIARPPASSTQSLVVVINWVEELKRLLPAN